MSKLSETELRLVEKYEAASEEEKAQLHEKLDFDAVKKHLEKFPLQKLEFYGLLDDEKNKTYLIKDCFLLDYFAYEFFNLFDFSEVSLLISPYKCVHCSNNKFGKQKGIFRAKSEGKAYKKSSITSHLYTCHTPSAAKTQGSKKRKVEPINLTTLSLNGKLSDKLKDEIMQAKIDLVCDTGLSLNALTSPVFSNYERLLWKYSNNDLGDFGTIPSSRRKF